MYDAQYDQYECDSCGLLAGSLYKSALNGWHFISVQETPGKLIERDFHSQCCLEEWLEKAKAKV